MVTGAAPERDASETVDCVRGVVASMGLILTNRVEAGRSLGEEIARTRILRVDDLDCIEIHIVRDPLLELDAAWRRLAADTPLVVARDVTENLSRSMPISFCNTVGASPVILTS